MQPEAVIRRPRQQAAARNLAGALLPTPSSRYGLHGHIVVQTGLSMCPSAIKGCLHPSWHTPGTGYGHQSVASGAPAVRLSPSHLPHKHSYRIPGIIQPLHRPYYTKKFERGRVCEACQDPRQSTFAVHKYWCIFSWY